MGAAGWRGVVHWDLVPEETRRRRWGPDPAQAPGRVGCGVRAGAAHGLKAK